MLLGVRHITDIATLALALLLQDFVLSRLFSSIQANRPFFKRLSLGLRLLLSAGLVWIIVDSFVQLPKVGIKEIIVWWGLAMLAAAAAARLFPPIPENPERRMLLATAGRAAVAAPLLITGTAAAYRNEFHVAEIDVRIPGLPKDLDGLKIVQLTDIHLGPFLVRRELARAVDMANGLRAHIAVITGDIITSHGDPLDDGLQELARLRADAGVFGCHGNHEKYAAAEEYATTEGRRLGIDFLRGEARSLRFGSASLNLVGVDYQRSRRPYLVGTENLIAPGNVNLLLSHNPDVFPVAKQKGFALTLAGHTHGGQVNFEILHRDLNIAKFITPYTKGLYTEDGLSAYVSTGIGTVGIPVRLGAPPEVALVRLCAT